MELVKDIIKYALVVMVVILLKIYVVAPIQINGASMEPTLLDRDMMILNKLAYKFGDVDRFDLIVIKYDDPAYLVKRVVGLPNEIIEYKDGDLYVDDVKVEETMITELTDDFGPFEVPEGSYFVMGDNRNNSVDSRVDALGAVSLEEISGKVRLMIWPFSKFGFIE